MNAPTPALQRSDRDGQTLSHQFLWFDLETTGLDPHSDLILEWALALCEDAGPEDSGTNEPDHGMPIVQQYEGVVSYGKSRVDELRLAAHPIVQDMHTKNGLWDACSLPPNAEGLSISTLEEADNFLRELCCELTGQAKPTGLVLAGASVHFDLGFVRVHFPRFAKCLSHRVFDVSTLTQAERSWGESDVDLGGGGDGTHRAMTDVQHAIERAAFFRARRWRIGL